MSISADKPIDQITSWHFSQETRDQLKKSQNDLVDSIAKPTQAILEKSTAIIFKGIPKEQADRSVKACIDASVTKAKNMADPSIDVSEKSIDTSMKITGFFTKKN